MVLNQTPFYGESGGQVGDIGVMSADGVRFRVTETQKKAGDLFVHIGVVEQGMLKPGAALQLDVDHARRTSIRANHSATHLLHEALRQVLGDHVAQKGSLVAPDRLRFDFSHPKPMTAEEIEKVEDIANDYVTQNSAVTTRLMALDDARASGARALFGEKYGDEVRVVAMGDGRGQYAGLVGGIVRRHPCQAHRRYRPDFGGLRFRRRRGRAPARGADRPRRAQGRQRHHAGGAVGRERILRVSVADMPARITSVARRAQEARTRSLRCAKRSLPWAAAASPDAQGDRGASATGRRHQAARARGRTASTSKDLRSLADEGKKQVGSGVVAIVGKTDDGKAGIVVGVTADLDQALQRGRPGARGRRGARRQGRRRPPDMAQAGGPDGSKADAALKAIEAALGAG